MAIFLFLERENRLQKLLTFDSKTKRELNL